jgi:uncharacterized protein (DUF4415 family)
MPTPEEDAEINRGIAADPDNPEWTSEDMARARPFPELVAQKRMGRPPKENPKEQVSVRYDADILAAFRATGEGWQTRMNDALRTTWPNIRSRKHMDSDAERLARVQRVIDGHREEIERLRNRPTWLSVIGVIAIIVVGGGLVELVRHLI